MDKINNSNEEERGDRIIFTGGDPTLTVTAHCRLLSTSSEHIENTSNNSSDCESIYDYSSQELLNNHNEQTTFEIDFKSGTLLHIYNNHGESYFVDSTGFSARTIEQIIDGGYTQQE